MRPDLQSASDTKSGGVIARAVVVSAALLPLAVLGPYVGGQIRTEQVFLFGLAALSVIIGPISWPRLDPGPVPFILLFSVPLVIAMLGAIQPPSLAGRLPGDLLSNFSRLAIPLACILIAWRWIQWIPASKALDVLSFSWIAGAAVAGVVAFLQLQFGAGSLPFLGSFVTSSGSEGSVSELALAGGRAGGIFNQPAEAGLAFSTALVLAGRLVVRSKGLRWLVILLVGGVVLGGVAADSKIFAFVGLPLALVAMFALLRVRWFPAVILLAGIVATLALAQSVVANYRSFGVRTVEFDGNVVEQLFGGRAGNGPSQYERRWELAAAIDPIVGAGLRGVSVSKDSQFAETILLSGAIGVAAVVSITVLWVKRWFQLRRRQRDADTYVAAALVALVTIAGLGLPSLSSHRSSSIILLCLSLLLICVFETPSPRRSSRFSRLESEGYAGHY